MKNLKYYLTRAKKQGWAVGQFNFSTLEQFQAIIRASKRLRAPVILGTSEGESKFFGFKEAAALRKVYADLPVFLHLDHAKSLEYIKEAIAAGYDSVHFDGSKLSLGDNISTSKKVVEYAHKRKVLVETELGIIGSDSSRVYKFFKAKKENFTKIEEIERFLKEVKTDSLAISIGNFHGMEVKALNPHLDLLRLREISLSKAKNVFLVLHGGSGTPRQDIVKAIKLGIVKVNINTELRVAFAKSLKRELGDEIAPYKYLAKPIAAVQKIVEDKIKLFKSNNKYG